MTFCICTLQSAPTWFNLCASHVIGWELKVGPRSAQAEDHHILYGVRINELFIARSRVQHLGQGMLVIAPDREETNWAQTSPGKCPYVETALEKILALESPK